MPPEAKHVGITYRSKGKSTTFSANQSGYVVQTHGRTHGGFHSTYDAALKTLCEATGVKSTQQLKLKPKFRKAARWNWQYQTPYVRQRAGSGQWYCPQVPLGKSYPTCVAAAKALKTSAKGKVFLASAKKQITGEPTIRQVSPKQLAHRIRCLVQFAFGSRKRKWLPADAHAAAQHRTLSNKMYQCDGVLHFLSLVLKYGPWKVALLQAWKNTKRWPAVECQSAESEVPDYKKACQNAGARAKAVHHLLADVAKRIQENPVKPEWAANTNRHGGRFNGPAVQLQLSFCVYQK